MSKASNTDRARWRAVCRKKLADHISKYFIWFLNDANHLPEQSLNFDIDPADIRLLPAKDDPYRWQPVPDKAYLFDKHLSRLSIGPLMELCKEVGKSFRAVSPSVDAAKAAPFLEQSQRKESQRSHGKETNTIFDLEKKLQLYRRERSRLKRQNNVQAVLITKYRRLMGGFMEDTSFISHS